MGGCDQYSGDGFLKTQFLILKAIMTGPGAAEGNIRGPGLYFIFSVPDNKGSYDSQDFKSEEHFLPQSCSMGLSGSSVGGGGQCGFPELPVPVPEDDRFSFLPAGCPSLGMAAPSGLSCRFDCIQAGALFHGRRDSFLPGRNPKEKRVLSFRETVFKFLAALLTLGSFGNGGLVGPLGRMSAGFMSGFGRLCVKLGMRKTLLPLFSLCGMASLLGTLMHSSIGAGIFAVEIILKTNMQYNFLFPAILASSASVYIAKSLGLAPLFNFNAPFSHTEMDIFLCALLVMVSAGFLGKGFILCYGKISRIFMRDTLLPPGRRTLLMAAGAMTASLTLLVNPALIGTSDGIFEALFTLDKTILYGHLPVEIPLFAVLLILLVCKGLANIFTVASGMSAGFTGPAIIMGLLLGAAFAEYFGIPEGSDEFYTLMAAGFASYFASMMNTPIASAVMTVEIFGLHYSLPAGLAAVVGYMVNQDQTLYDLVLDERHERLDELEQAEESLAAAVGNEGKDDGDNWEPDIIEELFGVHEEKREEE